jgi:hypothetical protein
MKATFITAAGLGAIALATSLVYAQAAAPTPTVDPIYGLGYGGWANGGYGYHSSTAAEGFLRGRAAVIRSAGEFNYTTSLAAINIQEAISRYIDNRAKWTDTYFAMRKTNQAYRDAERGYRPTQEVLNRISQEASPDRLKPSQLDPSLRTIFWPALLSKGEFDALRTQLDGLFAVQRANNSGLGTENFREIAALTAEMQILLDSMINQLHPDEYLAARRFIESLAYEARFPAGQQAVVTR